MPEIFRAFGFSFFFFSREHLPIHIHVEGKGGAAKYVLHGERFILEHSQGISKADLRKIEMMILENNDIIIKFWNSYFNGERS